MSKDINSLLIPNVSKLPSQSKVDVSNKLVPDENGVVRQSEFKQALDSQLNQIAPQHGVKLSLHAAKRLNERNMGMDAQEFFKIKDAIAKLKEKGGQDSLVVTSKGAYIVDVENNTIVTAMDKDNLRDNVFTKIDSTLIIN